MYTTVTKWTSQKKLYKSLPSFLMIFFVTSFLPDYYLNRPSMNCKRPQSNAAKTSSSTWIRYSAKLHILLQRTYIEQTARMSWQGDLLRHSFSPSDFPYVNFKTPEDSSVVFTSTFYHHSQAKSNKTKEKQTDTDQVGLLALPAWHKLNRTLWSTSCGTQMALHEELLQGNQDLESEMLEEVCSSRLQISLVVSVASGVTVL